MHLIFIGSEVRPAAAVSQIDRDDTAHGAEVERALENDKAGG